MSTDADRREEQLRPLDTPEVNAARRAIVDFVCDVSASGGTILSMSALGDVIRNFEFAVRRADPGVPREPTDEAILAACQAFRDNSDGRFGLGEKMVLAILRAAYAVDFVRGVPPQEEAEQLYDEIHAHGHYTPWSMLSEERKARFIHANYSEALPPDWEGAFGYLTGVLLSQTYASTFDTVEGYRSAMVRKARFLALRGPAVRPPSNEVEPSVITPESLNSWLQAAAAELTQALPNLQIVLGKLEAAKKVSAKLLLRRVGDPPTGGDGK